MERRPLTLLVNSEAGGKPGSGPPLHDDPARLEPDALAVALRGRGLDTSLREIEPDDDPRRLAAEAAEAGTDVAVAAGDGTVGAAAEALIGTDAALGIIPMGSFNNIARGLRLPDTLDAVLDVIATGVPTPVDIGWVSGPGETGRPFFEAAGVGLDAGLFLAIEAAERRGWHVAIGALWNALRARRTPMRIDIDGQIHDVGAPAVTVSNGPFHGFGFAVSPDADPTDGVLDVAVFAGMSRWEVLGHFAAVARRRPRSEPRVTDYLGRRIVIAGTHRPLPVHADGREAGMTPATLEVRPAGLRVLLERR